MVTDEDGHVKQWQGGNNCTFDLHRLSLTIKELNLTQKIDNNGVSPVLTMDRRTKIRLESSNVKNKAGDVIVIMTKFFV